MGILICKDSLNLTLHFEFYSIPDLTTSCRKVASEIIKRKLNYISKFFLSLFSLLGGQPLLDAGVFCKGGIGGNSSQISN